MADFAPPLAELRKSGLGVAAAPTGGMGLALDPKGRVPVSAAVDAPRVRVSNSAAIARASAAGTTIAWDTETYDSHASHDLVANTDRLTCKIAGIYHVYARGSWAANPTNGALIVYVNGAEVERSQLVADYRTMAFSTDLALSIDQYVTVVFDQFSGGAINLQAGATFGMTWLAPPP